MSADLDAIAQCAELIADHSARAPNAPLSKEWIRLTIEQAIAQDRKTREDAEISALGIRLVKGNSQLKWYNKAKAYGGIVHACSPALESVGYPVGLGAANETIAEAVNKLAAELVHLRQQLSDSKTLFIEEFTAREKAEQQLAQQSAALVVADKALKSSKHFLDNALDYGAINQHDVPKAEHCLRIVNAALAQLAEAPRENARALTSGEAVEARYNFLVECFNGCKWADVGPISHLRGDEKYIQSGSITRAIDAALRAPSRTEREDTAPEVGGKGTCPVCDGGPGNDCSCSCAKDGGKGVE